MLNFIMYCKTYSGDLQRFKTMLNSFNIYNKDDIKLYVSVPESELDIFKEYEQQNVKVISDESYAKDYFCKNQLHGLPTGYINQEICKLSFWETKISSNYICIDSDLIFIRPFYIKDFMVNSSTPYTILVMDKDLSIEKNYHKFWLWRQNFIQKIYDEVGLNDTRLRTCHGMQVLNSSVLESLKNDFMKNKNYSYEDLIRIAPYEFTWYNAWFQKSKLIPEYAVEPFFKTFHTRLEYIFSRLKKLTIEDYSYSYIGIILNSNWKKPTYSYEKASWWMKLLYKFLSKQ